MVIADYGALNFFALHALNAYNPNKEIPADRRSADTKCAKRIGRQVIPDEGIQTRVYGDKKIDNNSYRYIDRSDVVELSKGGPEPPIVYSRSDFETNVSHLKNVFGLEQSDVGGGLAGIEGFDIVGSSDYLDGFQTLLETSEGQYIGNNGGAYFLMDCDGKLLTPGGQSILRKEDPCTGCCDIFTAGHRFSGKREDMKCMEEVIGNMLSNKMGDSFYTEVTKGIGVYDCLSQDYSGSIDSTSFGDRGLTGLITEYATEAIIWGVLSGLMPFEYREDGLYARMKQGEVQDAISGNLPSATGPSSSVGPLQAVFDK